jgi:hypothetical protein
MAGIQEPIMPPSRFPKDPVANSQNANCHPNDQGDCSQQKVAQLIETKPE